jgi:hypothetical protein
MSSNIPQKLNDLVAERTNVLLYERRIIHERDEILRNVYNHLNQLDEQIVSLGGTARSLLVFDAATTNSSNGFHPSTSMTCGEGPGTITIGEKENCASPWHSSNDDASPMNSSSASSTEAASSSTLQKKRSHRKMTKDIFSPDIAIDPTSLGEPWTCECGNRLAAGRKRCGQCLRWKGGKRLVRWHIQPKDPTNNTIAAPGGTTLVESISPLSTICHSGNKQGSMNAALDEYMNLRAAELKSVAFGALSAGTLDEGLEIHKVVGQMVMAVANIAENRPGTKTKGVGGAAIQNNGKRKRGRPRRKESAVDSELIDRLVSTNDSDNESLNVHSKKLAKSYKETANLSLEVEIAESGKANLLLDVNEPLPIEQTIHEVETIASQMLCDNEVESTITI